MIELKLHQQWVVAGADKIPMIEYNGQLYRHSVTSGHYMTYEQACDVANRYGLYIGFVLTDNDPFTCIDLDVKHDTSIEQLDKFSKIVDAFDSYTELSASGNGVHIWVKGDVGKGKRTSGIEIYSRERFIIMTNRPIDRIKYITCKGEIIPLYQRSKYYAQINERQHLLNMLAKECKGPNTVEIQLTEREERLSDADIWKKAVNAHNGSKFVDLCEGRWQMLGYPSQSEADLALMAILAFYSDSNEQCRRMFRQTYLGVRSKAVRDDVYLNRCLKAVRARMEFDNLVAEQEQELAKNKAKELAEQLKQQAPDYRDDVPRVHFIDKFGNIVSAPYIIEDFSNREYFKDKFGNIVSAPVCNNIKETNNKEVNIIFKTNTAVLSNFNIDIKVNTISNNIDYSINNNIDNTNVAVSDTQPNINDNINSVESNINEVSDYIPAVIDEDGVILNESEVINNENSMENNQNNNTINSNILPANNSNVSLINIPSTLYNDVKNYEHWPPGVAGELAKQIFINSYRPVPEVSITAAIGFLAGVCGNTYHASGTGLNVYLVLVAKSAIGKESMHSGISLVCKKISENGVSNVNKFVNFSDFASGSALMKSFEDSTSFVNISGEFGKKMQRFSDGNAPESMKTLRTAMTNIYQKSGPYAEVGGISYSDKSKNLEINGSIAYSLIGETTPDSFYNSLSGDMMEDGFLSRFTMIEYKGERPKPNKSISHTIAKPLLDKLTFLVKHSLEHINDKTYIAITYANDDVVKMLDDYSDYCDKNIIAAGSDESIRQMYNRAQLKALRLASLCACADNPKSPVLTVDHLNWAINLINRDIDSIKSKLMSGEIGTDDGARNSIMLEHIKSLIQDDAKAGYLNISKDILSTMLKDNIVPYRYLYMRVRRVNAFSSHRMGLTFAIKNTLTSLEEQGIICNVDKSTLINEYSYHGKAIRLVMI